MVAVQPRRQIVERMFVCVTSGFITPAYAPGRRRSRAPSRGRMVRNTTATATTSSAASNRSSRVARFGTAPDRTAAFAGAKTLFRPCLRWAIGSRRHGRARVRPSGPYSLALSARLAGDATRRFRDGVVTARHGDEIASAWQAPNGAITLRGPSEEAVAKLRWTLALDDDHSDFLRRFGRDPLLGRTLSLLRGLRPVRTATVAHALLRAVCGQLVDWKTARNLEFRVIRALQSREQDVTVAATGLREPPESSALAAMAPFELRRVGLHERRAAALVRVCRALDLEQLRDHPTAAVVARISRERGLGPWSAGVVCLEGLGRTEHGLVGDLGLVKLLRELRGRPVEGWETAELLEPYGEWAGLASVYLLAGYHRGLVPVEARQAA